MYLSVDNKHTGRFLRLHRLDEGRKSAAKVFGLLRTQIVDQLGGDMGWALQFRQQIVQEEVDRFLTASLNRVAKEHGNVV